MGNLTTDNPKEGPESEYKTPKVENVGEAFMDWAENNWGLEKIIIVGMRNNDDNCESCPYKYLRETFINKINELVKNKV